MEGGSFIKDSLIMMCFIRRYQKNASPTIRVGANTISFSAKGRGKQYCTPTPREGGGAGTPSVTALLAKSAVRQSTLREAN